MPLVDFDAYLGPGGLDIYADIVAEEPYATGLTEYPDRYDDDSERRILIMIDVMRAYLETLTRRDELQRFHHAMSRILGEVAYNRLYDDLGARVVGNVPVTGTAGGETVVVDVIAPDGSVATTTATAAANGTLAALIADLNGKLPAEVESFSDGDKLGFRLTAAGEAAGSSFLFDPTSTLIPVAGVKRGPHVIAVRAAARRARDKGLDHYHKEVRADVQP